MTPREAIKQITTRLLPVSNEAETEARIMLGEATGLDRARIFLSEKELDADALSAVEEMIKRRLSGEPLQYILGRWSFMGLEFNVSPAALIPRQDTETLCEEALSLIKERGYKTLLDICTGTGCVAVSLNKLSGIRTEASDISPACVRLARENALKNGAEVTVREADLFFGASRYDIVTANPPYINDEDMAHLPEEVKREPALALAGGRDGLDLYRRIAADAAEHILPGGALVMEVGMGEADAVRALFPGRETRTVKDLNGIERVVSIGF